MDFGESSWLPGQVRVQQLDASMYRLSIPPSSLGCRHVVIEVEP
jgi:hypothetical protein